MTILASICSILGRNKKNNSLNSSLSQKSNVEFTLNTITELQFDNLNISSPFKNNYMDTDAFNQGLSNKKTRSISSFSQFNVKKNKSKNDSITLFLKSNDGYTNSMVSQIDGRFDNLPPISQKPPNKPNANI
ncbi:hypothetical protein ACTFIY_008649 [Dictyostelium cf. discoideum]